VPTTNSELSFTIDSPEGQREAALFPYAGGDAPGKEISIEESLLLGKAVANIHNLSDDFIPTNERRVLDINYLLDDSVAAIGPFLDSSSRVYLKILQKKIHHALASVSIDKMLVGICIGDVNPSNVHIDSDKQLTLFDFDQCGYGFRAFDIGKFISSLPLNKKRQVLRMAFIDGYKRVRTLTPQEYASIPYFEIIAVIWVMAIHVYNVDRIGYKFLEGSFWNRKMAMLRELDKRARWK
jgi:Ser/Thr protein kinase RdoA (MazF antagonist)